jgi:flagellar biogenesis protein FliO
MTGQRHRNFGAVMERHEKEMRIKKVFRVFSLLLIILILIALIFFINQIEQKASKKKTSLIENNHPSNL